MLHGLPHDYTLADGDLLTLDLAVSLRRSRRRLGHQLHRRRRRSRAESVALIDATERALAAGIAAARPGPASATSRTPSAPSSTEAGYPVNTEFGGHGIGSTMHQDPHVPNTGRPGRGYKLRPGLLLALEPWVMADTAELVTDADGWTLRSATGCRTAHSEHTIAITATAPRS